MERKGEVSPVYEVKPENGVGRRRVIHRNLLLPCNDSPFEVRQDKIRRKPKRVLKRSNSPKILPDPSPENSSDDEPDEVRTKIFSSTGQENGRAAIFTSFTSKPS